MDKVSVIIPARNEPYLQMTVDDIFLNATGPVEVVVILDGYWPSPPLKDREGQVIIHNGEAVGMRRAINAGVDACRGKYIMKLDAHCALGKGFDKALAADCRPDWLCVPSRYSLDVETWTRTRGPIDYLTVTYPYGTDEKYGYGFHGKKLTGKTRGKRGFFEFERDRAHVLIDDIPVFQGSCWFMEKNCFYEIEGLWEHVHTFYQESQELAFKVWLSGGRVVRNKNTWYAHWHKTESRGYKLTRKGKHEAERFMVDFWMNDRWEKAARPVSWYIDKFSDIFSWPQGEV